MAAVAHIKSIPASKWVTDRTPLETPDDVRTNFTFGDFFDLSSGFTPKIHIGLQRISPLDFSVLESAGAGTGFDTIALTFAPEAGVTFHIDFIKI